MKLLSAKCGEVSGSVSVPGSKSYTHRAIILSSLSSGESEIINPLYSQDTLATQRACVMLGAEIKKERTRIVVNGKGRPETPKDIINVMNSGTTLRLLTSLLGATRYGYSVLTGDESIRKRPVGPLLTALEKIGVIAWSSLGNGCAPLIVKGGGIKGGETSIDCSLSSQYLSSLLISCVLAERKTRITALNTVSRPYVDSTIFMIEKFGASIYRQGYNYFEVLPQEFKRTRFAVPADFSSASFVFACVALASGSVFIKNLDSSFPQADSKIVEIAIKMGMKVRMSNNGVFVSSRGKLEGGTFDLHDCPDLLPVVSVMALNANSTVKITGVEHARYKETDRIRMIATELSKTGASIDELRDGLEIKPTHNLRACILRSHGDHRLFMAFFIASLLKPGKIYVEGKGAEQVSYPSFLEDMKRLGITIMEREE